MADQGFDAEIAPGVVVHVNSMRVEPGRLFLGDREVTGGLRLTVDGDRPYRDYLAEWEHRPMPQVDTVSWGTAWTDPGYTDGGTYMTCEVEWWRIGVDQISPVEMLRGTVDLRARQRWSRKRRRR